MTDSLPTITDIKSISLEEFDRMSGSAARSAGGRDTTVASVRAMTRSLPTGVTPNTFEFTPGAYRKALLLNFLVKASNGLINVHSMDAPTTNTEIQGKPVYPRSYDGVRPSNAFSRDTQRASSINLDNAGEQTTSHSFITSGRRGYQTTGGVYARGYCPRRSGPLPRADTIRALKRKLQESEEAICTLKKVKRSCEEGVVWDDNAGHPVDLRVTGKVDYNIWHTFSPHPVGASSATSPDAYHVKNDAGRSTRDAQSQEVKNSSPQNSPGKKRRSLSEIVNSLTSKQFDQESSK